MSLRNKVFEEFSIYKLQENLLLFINFISEDIEIYHKEFSEEKLNELITGLKKFKIKYNYAQSIYLLTKNYVGINKTPLQITKPKLSLNDNYNDDFKLIHQIIQARLSKINSKGLVILHGKPGTGKTSYIRYLITSVKKDIIFLPPNMANVITNPDFIQVLISNPNTILVIEDAENIITDREHKGTSAVSALLNVADGLLSDYLNIQIICSFNTDISKVDSALLRKGRLIAKYEFKDLEADKANALSKKLGFPANFEKPASLASIYNQNENHIEEIKTNNLIGFKTLNCN